MKKYILIAGVNGAGKSTLYQTLHSLHCMERINTDEILKKRKKENTVLNSIMLGLILLK